MMPRSLDASCSTCDKLHSLQKTTITG
jgi:hypothetical protein